MPRTIIMSEKVVFSLEMESKVLPIDSSTCGQYRTAQRSIERLAAASPADKQEVTTVPDACRWAPKKPIYALQMACCIMMAPSVMGRTCQPSWPKQGLVAGFQAHFHPGKRSS